MKNNLIRPLAIVSSLACAAVIGLAAISSTSKLTSFKILPMVSRSVDPSNLSVSFNKNSTVESGTIKSGSVVLSSTLQQSGIKVTNSISGESWGANNNDIARLTATSQYMLFSVGTNAYSVSNFKNIKSISFTYNTTYNSSYSDAYGYFKVYFAKKSDFSDAVAINIQHEDVASVSSNIVNAKYVKVTGYGSSKYVYFTSATINYSCVEDSEVKALSSISVSGQTDSFTVGDTFSFGGTVTAHYSNSDTADVTSSATFSGYDLSSSGEQTVIVSYTESGTTKTTTYSINVNSSGTDYAELAAGVYSFTNSFSTTYTFSLVKSSMQGTLSSTSFTLTFSWSYDGEILTLTYLSGSASANNYKIFGSNPVANVTTNTSGVFANDYSTVSVASQYNSNVTTFTKQ